MLLIEIAKQILCEKMSYADLFRSSTKKRKERAKSMQFVNRLPIRAQKTDNYWDFRYKSAPGNNTTGNSYRGRISFFKPRTGRFAENAYCEVDCGCPDYTFRWAYANNRRGAGPMGSNSINQCNGARPNITNPGLRPGMCKHLLALRDQLRQKLTESQEPTIEGKFDEIVEKYPSFEIEIHE